MRKTFSSRGLALAACLALTAGQAAVDCGYSTAGPSGAMFVLEPDPDAPARDPVERLLPTLPDVPATPRKSTQEPRPGAILFRDESAAIIARRVTEARPSGPVLVRTLDDARIIAQIPDTQAAATLVTMRGQLGFHLVAEFGSLGTPAGPGQIVAQDGTNGRAYVLDGDPVLTSADLVDSQPAFHPRTGTPVINFRFGEAGRETFAAFTAEHVGELLAIVLDGEVLIAPRIQAPILGGAGFIEGNISIEEAQNMSVILRSGSLPAPLRVVSKREVGPLHRNRALVGPAVMIALASRQPTDAEAICDRLSALEPADISVQSAGPAQAEWLLWIELRGGRTPEEAMQTVRDAFGAAAELSAVHPVGPNLLASQKSILGNIRKWFD